MAIFTSIGLRRQQAQTIFEAESLWAALDETSLATERPLPVRLLGETHNKLPVIIELRKNKVPINLAFSETLSLCCLKSSGQPAAVAKKFYKQIQSVLDRI